MKTLINIFGAGRSGTTMLDLMLGHDSNSFSLGEVHAWFRPFREHHFKIICSCGKEPCPYWQRIQHCSEDEFHQKAFKTLNVDFLIDSSKSLNWGIDNNFWAMKNDIRVVNILMYKEPINYIYSIWKRGEDIDSAIYRYVTYYKRFFQTNLHFVSIKYEDLVSNSDEILKKICDCTGQKYFKNKKQFWLKTHHQAFGSSGTRKQVELGKSDIKMDDVFPKEYIDIIPEINNKLNMNEDYIHIKEAMNLNDISNGCTTMNSEKLNKPLWYYLGKIKAIYKKRFPDKWEKKQ